MAQTLGITSVGAHARRALLAGGTAEVLAIFERSLHVRLPAGIVCVGGEEIGQGPLNAIVGEPPSNGWQHAGLDVGTRGEAREGHVDLGAVTLAFADAVSWAPAPWPHRPPPHALRRTLAQLGDLVAASDLLPLDGCARVAFGNPVTTGIAGVVVRKALLATATLGDWLADALAQQEPADPALAEAARESVAALLGLGPGLTPAGDDVLSGLLIGLHAAGEAQVASALATMIRAAPSDATSVLGRAFLDAAIDGLPAEPIAAAAIAVLAGDETRLPAVIERIDGVGHTSGWDMLAGVVLALAAVSAT